MISACADLYSASRPLPVVFLELVRTDNQSRAVLLFRAHPVVVPDLVGPVVAAVDSAADGEAAVDSVAVGAAAGQEASAAIEEETADSLAIALIADARAFTVISRFNGKARTPTPSNSR